jgi:hypothetical protein
MTPWVIQNLGLLGAKLGLPLTYIAYEAPLGTLRADILAAGDAGRTVVIENQFGPTDMSTLPNWCSMRFRQEPPWRFGYPLASHGESRRCDPSTNVP